MCLISLNPWYSCSSCLETWNFFLAQISVTALVPALAILSFGWGVNSGYCSLYITTHDGLLWLYCSSERSVCGLLMDTDVLTSSRRRSHSQILWSWAPVSGFWWVYNNFKVGPIISHTVVSLMQLWGNLELQVFLFFLRFSLVDSLPADHHSFLELLFTLV